MKKDEALYSDLDLTFKPHPLTGDLMPKINVEAIRRSLRYAFFIEKYDIPFNKKNSNLKRLLFEPMGQTTEISIRATIDNIFKSIEPRVKLISTEVEEDKTGKGYNITVTYQVKSLMIEDSYRFFAERPR